MSGPDRIWATAYYSQSRSEHVREWSERGYDDRQAYQYIRHDPAVLAALPEVQALIAGAYEAAAKAVADSEFDHPRRYNTFSRLADRIRAMIPADAIAARDAMIAEAVAKEREACAQAAHDAVTHPSAYACREAIRKRGEG